MAVKRIGLEAATVVPHRIRAEKSGIRNVARKRRIIGYDGQDRSQECPRDRPVDPDGLIPAGARKARSVRRSELLPV